MLSLTPLLGNDFGAEFRLAGSVIHLIISTVKLVLYLSPGPKNENHPVFVPAFAIFFPKQFTLTNLYRQCNYLYFKRVLSLTPCFFLYFSENHMPFYPRDGNIPCQNTLFSADNPSSIHYNDSFWSIMECLSFPHIFSPTFHFSFSPCFFTTILLCHYLATFSLPWDNIAKLHFFPIILFDSSLPFVVFLLTVFLRYFRFWNFPLMCCWPLPWLSHKKTLFFSPPPPPEKASSRSRFLGSPDLCLLEFWFYSRYFFTLFSPPHLNTCSRGKCTGPLSYDASPSIRSDNPITRRWRCPGPRSFLSNFTSLPIPSSFSDLSFHPPQRYFPSSFHRERHGWILLPSSNNSPQFFPLAPLVCS